MRSLIRLGVSLSCGLVGLLALSGTAGASAQKLPAPAFNPAITGPAPPFVSVAANCPAFLTTDAWNLNFVSGNAVFYGTENKNGDWGGGNGEGTAVLSTSDGAMQYSGHLHVWFGQGENSLSGANQTETGFTASYKGSGPAGSISINAHMHATTNNSGTPTANVAGGTVSCS